MLDDDHISNEPVLTSVCVAVLAGTGPGLCVGGVGGEPGTAPP